MMSLGLGVEGVEMPFGLFDFSLEIGGILFGFECHGSVFDVITMARDIIAFAIVVA